jgi:hypothetical protein
MGPLGHSLAALCQRGASRPCSTWRLARRCAPACASALGLAFARGQATPERLVHAASVGEGCRAAVARPAARRRPPGLRSTVTVTGREALRRGEAELAIGLARSITLVRGGGAGRVRPPRWC